MNRKNPITKLLSEISEAQSISSVLRTALENYVNNPHKSDIHSILHTVKIIDKKLFKAIDKFENKA
jgi:hypothetical protein